MAKEPIIDVTDFVEVEDRIDIIEESRKRAAAIVHPVMAGITISEVELEVNREPADFVKILGQRLTVFRRTIENQLVAAGIELPDDFPWTIR